jgi:hypothetical protein
MTSEIQLVAPRSQESSVLCNAMRIRDVAAQVAYLQNLMGAVMRENEHYGRIPGCGDKPVLLKAGAEKLCLTFRLAAEPRVRVVELPGGHREYRIKCILSSIETGRRLGAGVGTCSTLEAKYRYRPGEGEPTGRPVPPRYWDLRKSDRTAAQQLLGGKSFAPRKNATGDWEIFRLGEKVEHDNPADHYNTCLKMAKKRSLVDAVLTVTAASDIFTQDIEDLGEYLDVSNGAHSRLSAQQRCDLVASIRSSLRKKDLDATDWPGCRDGVRPSPMRMRDHELIDLARWCDRQLSPTERNSRPASDGATRLPEGSAASGVTS